MDTTIRVPDTVPARLAFDVAYDELVAARIARDEARRVGAPVPELAAASCRLDRARQAMAIARSRWLAELAAG